MIDGKDLDSNCLKKHSMVPKKGPNGPKMGPKWSNGPFGPLWSVDKPAIGIFCPKWTIFGPSPVIHGGHQSKKKAHHQVSYVWPARGTPISTFWYINMVAIYEKCQK